MASSALHELVAVAVAAWGSASKTKVVRCLDASVVCQVDRVVCWPTVRLAVLKSSSRELSVMEVVGRARVPSMLGSRQWEEREETGLKNQVVLILERT